MGKSKDGRLDPGAFPLGFAPRWPEGSRPEGGPGPPEFLEEGKCQPWEERKSAPPPQVSCGLNLPLGGAGPRSPHFPAWAA